MKKVFTSISLAAMTFMATMPAMAQQQELTDQQKAEVITTVVPTIFDQVKQISGIDIIGLANPTIENVLESPLFGIQSNLRSATATSLSIQPDSVIIPSAGSLGKMKIEFSEFKEYELTKLTGMTTTLNFPEKIFTEVAPMPMLSIPVTVTLKAGEKNGLLPFSTFNVGLDLGNTFNTVLGFKGATDILTLTETVKDGTFTYDIVLTDDLRSGLKKISNLAAMLPENIKEKLNEIIKLAEMPNYQIKADISKLPEINASLAAVVSTTTTLPIGLAKISLDPEALANNKIAAKEILLTSYEDNSTKIEGYEKIVMGETTVENNIMTSTKTIYEAEGENLPEEGSEDWESATIKTTYTNTKDNKIDPENLIPSILAGIITDISKGTQESFKFEKKVGDDVETRVNVTTGMIDIQTATASILIEDEDEDDAEDMRIKLTLPLKGETVKVDFIPASYENNPAAIMYIKSNLGGVVTSNETITPELDATIIVAENGLYINNCENAQYTIVNMAGKPMANGIISGDGAFVATPSLQRGQIYIVTVVENGAKKSIKFIKR